MKEAGASGRKLVREASGGVGWDSEVEVKRLCKASSRPESKKRPPLRVVREERVGERARRREIRG